MSLSQRVAAGLAIGAAALALPLAASPAYADDWHIAGGFGDQSTCIIEAHAYIFEEDNHDYTEYRCVQNGDAWQVWVR